MSTSVPLMEDAGSAFHCWRRVASRAGLFGSGRVRAQVCQNVSGLHTQVFYTIRSNDFFLSRSAFFLLTVVTSVKEVVVIFLQLILFANTAAFFCFLLGLVSYTFSEGTAVRKLARDGNSSKRSITYAILHLC